MVLSNKRLKQKLREELAKSLSGAAAGPDPNLQSQGLKELLDSSTRRPRLSKREKRRKSRSLDGLEAPKAEIDKEKNIFGGGGDDTENNDERSKESEKSKKEGKKRKRDEVKSGESGGAEDGHDSQKKSKKLRKKKKVKKKSKQKGNTRKNEEQKAEETTHMEVERHVHGIVPNKVYVGGIPYDHTEDEIHSYFKRCGNIVQVDRKMRPEDGEFSGIAFITFETEDAAKRALALDRAAMVTRFLTIQQYMKSPLNNASGFAPKMVEGYNRIYVGNLSWDIAEHDIRKLFSDCIITSIRFGKNKETGEFKGYAHVDFKDYVSMAKALKLNQEIVRGRPVKISCATPKRDANLDPSSLSVTCEADVGTDDLKSAPVTIEAGIAGSTTAVSGKIRRRTCYECGEKGHLSSACPRKQNTDQENSNTA